jgi:peptide/nickel transport system substrate-binding protein
VQIRERALHFNMRAANELMTEIWNEDTTAFPFTGNSKFDPRNATGMLTVAPLYTRWLASGGKDGVEPNEPFKRIMALVDTARSVGRDGQIQAA